ncbi:MAG: hypothetical protein AABW48_05535 [Nanoarchaeota archaeon]
MDESKLTLENIIAVPKAALHTHLDGAIRSETLLELSREQGKNQEYQTTEDIISDICFQENWSLPRCLSSFAKILSVLQDGNSLERVTYEHLEDLYKDGVVYAEVRFGPFLHGQLRPEEAVERVGEAIKRARTDFPKLQAWQKLSILRNNGVKEAEEVAKLALAMFGKSHNIVAVDLAGNEFSHPPELFVKVYKKLRDSGIGLEAHAGEGPTLPVLYENKLVDVKKHILDSINLLGVSTLGHAYAMRNNPKIQEYVFSKGVKVIGCPTSSIHTKSIDSMKDSPLVDFFNTAKKYSSKPLVAVDADNYFLSRTTTSTEIFKLAVAHNLNFEQAKELALGSLQCGFREYLI